MSTAARGAGALAGESRAAFIGPTYIGCCSASIFGFSRMPGAPYACYNSAHLLEGRAMSTIESVLQETRVFQPPAQLVREANVSGMDAYEALRKEAERDFE